MNILTACHTDVGIKKDTNQDSFCIKIADTSIGKVVLAVICDGMGGLSKGEVASASLIKAFSDWFDNELKYQLAQNDNEQIKYRWDRIIKEQNQKIAEYGRNVNIQLGTTLTAMLFIDNKSILIGHVGDSRAYIINNSIKALTDDQTVVARDLKTGVITAEQAESDPRRNVLLQCIGASKIVEPDYLILDVVPGSVYMLCSDGFRHVISENEILTAFSPNDLSDESIMQERAKKLVDLNKQRQETDNITVILIKII